MPWSTFGLLLLQATIAAMMIALLLGLLVIIIGSATTQVRSNILEEYGINAEKNKQRPRQ